MTHLTGSREEWLAARKDLLLAEKELTHKSDELAQLRQKLPWVRVEKDYRLTTDHGTERLADLFRGRSQLLVYHFMFGPEYEAGCPSCSMIADGFNGFAVHLAHHDVMLWAISRAPLPKLVEYKQRMGWSFPWASSFESDFNTDYSVLVPEAQSAKQMTGGPASTFAAMCGVDTPTYVAERPGMSAFVQEHGAVHHAYSTYARGLDAMWGAYQWLDRAPKGRNETNLWWKRHDEYDAR